MLLNQPFGFAFLSDPSRLRLLIRTVNEKLFR